IFNKRRLGRDLLRVYPELLDNNILDLFFDCFVGHKITFGWRARLTPHAAASQVKELASLSIKFAIYIGIISSAAEGGPRRRVYFPCGWRRKERCRLPRTRRLICSI